MSYDYELAVLRKKHAAALAELREVKNKLDTLSARKAMNGRTVSTVLSAKEVADLDQMATAWGYSRSELLRNIVRYYLDQANGRETRKG